MLCLLKSKVISTGDIDIVNKTYKLLWQGIEGGIKGNVIQ